MNNTKPKTNRSRHQAGFSLVELMITMSLFFVILFSVYTLISHYANATRTEQARIKMQQESRYMMAAFAQELKEAGSVLTLAHTGTFLSKTPSFNGIYPLNHPDYPDGIIVAIGDPYAVPRLTADYSGGNTTMQVDNVVPPDYDASDPYDVTMWAAGDRGIVINETGYYVFQVSGVDIGTNTLTLRDTPVYYSGLLNTTASLDSSKIYTDPEPKGNLITYTTDSPVIRLSSFSIYLFKERWDDWHTQVLRRPIRQMIRVTDCLGVADVLASGSGAELNTISENIFDMQISYIGYSDFKTADRTTAYEPSHYFFGHPSLSTGTLSGLLTDIREKALKQLDITIVSITDQLGGRYTTEDSTKVYNIPAIGDRVSYDLPRGKYTFKIMSISVEPRNYNIII